MLILLVPPSSIRDILRSRSTSSGKRDAMCCGGWPGGGERPTQQTSTRGRDHSDVLHAFGASQSDGFYSRVMVWTLSMGFKPSSSFSRMNLVLKEQRNVNVKVPKAF